MNALTVAGRSIRLDDAGRLSLNDLHRAGGGANKNRPSQWLANRQTKDLITELDAEAGIPALAVQRGGARAGTYACREAALAFAAWIAPAFHVRVLRAADAVLTGQVQQPVQDVQAALNHLPTLRALLVDQIDARQRLEHRVAEQAPRAAALDRLAGARGAMSLTEAAKVLGMRPRDLITWLSAAKWIYRSHDAGSWLGHARHTDAGHLLHRVHIPVGSFRERSQVMLTPKGLVALSTKLEQASLPTAIQSPTTYREEFES